VGASAHRDRVDGWACESENSLPHEFRRAREDLGPDFYNSLTYFELWTQGFINLMQEKGVLTRAEVETRAAEIKDRLKRTE
jgi:hypothetical protein